jgi:hypothetical protein
MQPLRWLLCYTLSALKLNGYHGIILNGWMSNRSLAMRSRERGIVSDEGGTQLDYEVVEMLQNKARGGDQTMQR